MRALGVPDLAVQTAGFSGQMTPEVVSRRWSTPRSSAPASGWRRGATDLLILEELRRIRALLEGRR